MSDWFYARHGQQFGPTDEASLRTMLGSGALLPTDLVWRDGMPQWQPAEILFPGIGRMSDISAPPGGDTGGVLSYQPLPRPGEFVEYAGFWRRTAAAIIDWIILWAASAVVSAVVFSAAGALPGQPVPAANWRAVAAVNSFLTSLVMPWLYYALMTASKYRGTIGKLALGIEVVSDPQLQTISFLRATGRHAASYLSAFILLIGYLMVLFTDRKRTLHDMLASTVVIRRGTGTPHTPTGPGSP